MVKKKKMWKPGHLVTIEDKVYRVKGLSAVQIVIRVVVATNP